LGTAPRRWSKRREKTRVLKTDHSKKQRVGGCLEGEWRGLQTQESTHWGGGERLSNKTGRLRHCCPKGGKERTKLQGNEKVILVRQKKWQRLGKRNRRGKANNHQTEGVFQDSESPGVHFKTKDETRKGKTGLREN